MNLQKVARLHMRPDELHGGGVFFVADSWYGLIANIKFYLYEHDDELRLDFEHALARAAHWVLTGERVAIDHPGLDTLQSWLGASRGFPTGLAPEDACREALARLGELVEEASYTFRIECGVAQPLGVDK